MRKSTLMIAFGAIAAVGTAVPAMAQTPKKGGILNFAVVAEPPTLDCHATGTFAMVHPVAPQYSTLLKFTGPHDNLKMVGDLAESWEVAKDGLSYTFKLRKGVKFHDGTELTSADVKASYDRIVSPPEGVISQRMVVHQDIGNIETPDAHTVVFKMKQVNASMILHFASPFNCIYSAARLAKDPRFPEKEVMGTGAFQFVEYVKGSHWSAKRFDGYFQKDRPYLDGYKAFFVKTPAVVPGIRGGQFDAEFRGRTPAERDQIVSALKDDVVVVEGPWITNLQIAFNNQRKPFDDKRVRQALTLAIDRWGASESIGKVSLIKGVSGVFRPGAPWSLPKEELEKIPGFWRDINKSREEAKRLLKEAGVPNLKIKLLNRQIGEPFTPGGIYVIDQLRRIGVEVEHEQLETKLYFDRMNGGEFDMVVTNVSDFIDDPNAQFNTLLTPAKSGAIAYSRHQDTKVDQMYDRQSGTIDEGERKKLVNELEKYVLTEAHSMPLLWYQRIVVYHKKIKGWELQPSHFGGQTLVDVWLDQ
jgi:peptide/nickel transport system substrate-binding protein